MIVEICGNQCNLWLFIQTSAILLLQFCYKPYTAASQNLPYKNRKTAARFFSARFLGIFSLLVFLK
ncbi:MAG: hypothetical protein LBJ86_06180, partial [Spirochaetaceae bacterium]|nr:hypothetical protein [Spirochaetaceae bacterium]